MLRKSDHRRRADDGERNVHAPGACSGLVSGLLLCGSLAIAALVVGLADVKAQEAEPRSYSNTPVGLNFLIAGYVYAQGKMAFDPNLSIATPNSIPTPAYSLTSDRSISPGSRPSSMSSCRGRRSTPRGW
jgi:hypothetical protein